MHGQTTISTLELTGLLLREPERLLGRDRDDEQTTDNLALLAPRLLAITLLGAALLGVVIGSYRGELQYLYAALKTPLRAVEIMEMKDNIFFAELILGEGVRVSARPSDSIALALRVGAPIRCAEQVLADAGIIIPDEQEDEVEKFREFLDQVRPEDFAG